MSVARFLMTVVLSCAGVFALGSALGEDYTKFDFGNDTESAENAGGKENAGDTKKIGDDEDTDAVAKASDEKASEDADEEKASADEKSKDDADADVEKDADGNSSDKKDAKSSKAADASDDSNAENEGADADDSDAESTKAKDSKAVDSDKKAAKKSSKKSSASQRKAKRSSRKASSRNSRRKGGKTVAVDEENAASDEDSSSSKTDSEDKTAADETSDSGEGSSSGETSGSDSGASSSDIPIEDLMGAGTDAKGKSDARSKRSSKRSEDRRSSRSRSRKKRGETAEAKPKEEKERDVHEKMQVTKLESMKQAFPELHLIYYESGHFFFLTDAPQKIAVECIEYLEDAYTKLQNAFHMPTVLQVWQGKCMVVAFSEKVNFTQFETKFYNTEKKFLLADALTHLTADGNVLISTYYGDMTKKDRRWLFLATMMHEMSHGFVFRYKNRNPLPLWLDEGLADYMAKTMVPKSPFVASKQKEGMAIIWSKHSVGGLFTEEKLLQPWQYGVASCLVAYMLKTDSTAFGPLVDRIKAGEKWDSALKATYHCTPEELLKNFGRSYAISNLEP